MAWSEDKRLRYAKQHISNAPVSRQLHSAEEKEHGQRMVQRVQLHMHEGTLGRYRKGGRGSSQEPENVPRSRTGQLVELSTVRTPSRERAR